MSPWQAAHHPKPEAPSEHEIAMADLAAEWRARVASGFKATDPRTVAERYLGAARLASRLLAAKAWLAPAMVSQRRRDALRRSMRLIRGGRS